MLVHLILQGAGGIVRQPDAVYLNYEQVSGASTSQSQQQKIRQNLIYRVFQLFEGKSKPHPCDHTHSIYMYVEPDPSRHLYHTRVV
jgi:hypothetical protein